MKNQESNEDSPIYLRTSAPLMELEFIKGYNKALDEVEKMIKEKFASLYDFIETDRLYSNKYEQMWTVALGHIKILDAQIQKQIKELRGKK